MTDQKAWRCDVCFEILHWPDRSRGLINMEMNGKSTFEGDVCIICHEKIMKAINKIIEEGAGDG